MRPGRRSSGTDEESKKGPRAPKHTYSLADYGLTETGQGTLPGL